MNPWWCYSIGFGPSATSDLVPGSWMERVESWTWGYALASALCRHAAPASGSRHLTTTTQRSSSPNRVLLPNPSGLAAVSSLISFLHSLAITSTYFQEIALYLVIYLFPWPLAALGNTRHEETERIVPFRIKFDALVVSGIERFTARESNRLSSRVSTAPASTMASQISIQVFGKKNKKVVLMSSDSDLVISSADALGIHE